MHVSSLVLIIHWLTYYSYFSNFQKMIIRPLRTSDFFIPDTQAENNATASSVVDDPISSFNDDEGLD